MYFLLALILLVGGMAIGGWIVYRWEKGEIEDLIKQCKEANDRLREMIQQEEEFINSMWPKHQHHITMETNLADYLKAKYFDEETETGDWTDCEDESDNLYV